MSRKLPNASRYTFDEALEHAEKHRPGFRALFDKLRDANPRKSAWATMAIAKDRYSKGERA